jgi:transcriptional regulator with XRE-family HTH domain
MKKKRCAMGLSQKDFAELLKLSLSTYNNYERGIRTPRSVEIVRIAHILGVSTDWLLDEECNDGGNIKCANGY